MSLSLSLWEKSIIFIFFSSLLLSSEIYLRSFEKINEIEDILLLPEDYEGSCGIFIEIRNDLEEKILKNFEKIPYLRAINFNFIEEERDPFWASYLLKIFSLNAKAENPNIKIFLTGNIKNLEEDLEWYIDGIEGANIFSHLLKVKEPNLLEWIKEDSPFIISYLKDKGEAIFYKNFLKGEFFLNEYFKVLPQEIVPLTKEDLSFALLVPPNFKGYIFLPKEEFKGAYDLKGKEIELKKEKDGVSIYYEGGEGFNLIFLQREKGSFFFEKGEFIKEKDISLSEVLSKIFLYFSLSENKFSEYNANSITKLNISFGNFSKPFHVKIKGKMYFSKGEEFLWEWSEVEMEGAKYKEGDFLPIPVLQPEKVKINPFILYPERDYSYEILKVEGGKVILNFKPKEDFLKKGKPAFKGNIYLNLKDFFPEKILRKQVNLKKEFLSFEEELNFINYGGFPILKNYKAKQLLSILGGFTLVEVETNFSNMEKLEKKYEPPKDKIYFIRKEEGWVPSKKFPERFLTFGILKMPEEDIPLPLGGISWISLKAEKQYSYIFAGILGFFNRTYFIKNNSLTLDGFLLLLPFPDYPYKNGKKIKDEGVEIRPINFNLTLTSPLKDFLTLQTKIGFNYLDFESAKERNLNYSLPPSSFTFFENISLNFSSKGYNFSIFNETFQRNRDFKFGYEKREGYKNGSKWGLIFGKNLKVFNGFLHFDMGFYEGKDLDRFTLYKSGSFGNLEMEGFASGSILGERIISSHLSYNFDFPFLRNLNFGLDFLRTLKPEEENFLSLKFSTFFQVPYKTLMQVQGGFGLIGQGKGFSLRFLFFKGI